MNTEEKLREALQAVIASHELGMKELGERMRASNLTNLRIDGQAVIDAFAAIEMARQALALPPTAPVAAPTPVVSQDVRKLTLERDLLREKCRELDATNAFLTTSAPSQPAMPQGTNWHANHVIVCKAALQMVRNALRNDAERGLVVRGEMLEELDKVTYPVAHASQAHTSWTTIFEAGRHYWLAMRDGTIGHGAYEQLAQVFWTNKGVVSKENVLFVQPFIPPACPLIDTTDTALQSVLLTDLVKVLEDLQSAFMSHTRWSGPPPAEIVAARAVLSSISRKTPT